MGLRQWTRHRNSVGLGWSGGTIPLRRVHADKPKNAYSSIPPVKHTEGVMNLHFHPDDSETRKMHGWLTKEKTAAIVKQAKKSFPLYAQKTQYSCSAACLKSVLEHYGKKDIAEFELMHLIDVQQKGGAETDQIADAARALGFDCFEYSFKSLDQAKDLVDKDIPIIADIQSFKNPGSGHYVVISGITDSTVQLMDPNVDGNTRKISRAEMDKRWWDRAMKPPHKLMPRWGIVVLPPETKKLKTATINGFTDELEKLAAGVKVIHVPGMYTQHNTPGLYVPHETFANDHQLRAQHNIKPGQSAVFLPPKEEFVLKHGDKGADAYRAMRHHELTHHIRKKKGKFKGFGQPGARNLLRTGREEMAAYLSAAVRAKTPEFGSALAKGAVGGTLDSMRHAYPKGIKHTATEGTLKPAKTFLKKLLKRK